ncbi:MAG: hypothetical protein RJB14_602, partial [Pseudomonadota bacterium]
MFNQVPQALGQVANDNVSQLVVALLWPLWFVLLSIDALVIEYLSETALKLVLNALQETP